MPIKVTCPKCQGVLHAPDDAGGKRGKCPTCGTVLAIPAEGGREADSPEPYRAPEPPREESPGTHRSSFGAIPRPADPEPRRPATGSRLPAPPAFAPAEPRKLADPFAKADRRAVPGVPGDGLVRAWRRSRRGLWWVQLSLFLCLLGLLGFAGIMIAENLGVTLPTQDPGYLKQEGLSAATEIKLGVVLIPYALGFLAWTLGLFGFSNVPRSSFAKGLATTAAVAGLVALLGVIALAVPAGVQTAQGFIPDGLLPADDPNGLAQRAGIALAVVFGGLAEVWFVAALGRLAASLHDTRLGSRVTRFVVLAGLALAVAMIGGIAYYVYPVRIDEFVKLNVQPQWDKLGTNKPAVVWGLIALGGLIVWLIYTRLVGAARRAIREWLEQNEPAV
ncbi:MAG TPA: hypothetical protein VM533_15460 [Fimbriiglobus sp.]|jgi:hypothetical protein|nr:hypothetical protein [Fimbriiglobus sp.]